MLKKTNFIYMKLALTSNVTFFKVWISYATNITYNTDVAYIFPQFIKCPLFYLLFSFDINTSGSILRLCLLLCMRKTHLPGFHVASDITRFHALTN